VTELLNGDCLEEMEVIPSHSIDMILCDLPYGTTQNKWDSVIPFEPLWEQYRRVIKDNGAIVLFGQEPFSSKLRISNLDMYRYDLIWEKTKAGGFLNARRMPLQAHECISVFYKKLPTYNPQMGEGKPFIKKAVTNGDGKSYGKFERIGTISVNEGTRFPRSVLKFSNDNHNSLHPTQKPVGLLEWLVKTYTNKNETVLDNAMGSASTGIACLNTRRNFIGIEKDANYFEIAKKRIAETRSMYD
jgi:site-specific DNA-methyltransferase (adenine-specific)